MTTDLETDLRREFDAARPPSTLTFSPDSVLRQGSRTIRRRRIIAVGSTAMAVALVATGASLMTRPHNSAVPLPATRTATTGIVRAQAGFSWGQSELQLDRDPRVESNVRYSVMAKDGKWHEVNRSSTRKPGQKPDATWWSGIVDGHPVTIGLFPSSATETPTVTFGDGNSYPVGSEPLEGTGYRMFYVQYSDDGTHKEPARPAEIASIRWFGPAGVVDGIEGDHRLTGRTFTMNEALSVEVVLRPGKVGQSTVFGRTIASRGGNAVASFDLGATTTDPSGVAVVTGRTPILRQVKLGSEVTDGAPIAAGILPPGASDILVVLTDNSSAGGLAVTQLLPDGRVIFALSTGMAHPSYSSRDSIKAITWTNADATQGRKDVTQKQS